MTSGPDRDEQIRETLLRIADELRLHLAASDPSADSIAPDNAIGRLTRMEAIQARSMGDEGRRRAESRLKQVERALERLDKGVYRICIRCGAEIPAGRLEFMPEAAHCMPCAQRG
jgi:DnaK suppressor protein